MPRLDVAVPESLGPLYSNGVPRASRPDLPVSTNVVQIAGEEGVDQCDLTSPYPPWRETARRCISSPRSSASVASLPFMVVLLGTRRCSAESLLGSIKCSAA